MQSIIEDAALPWSGELGYAVGDDPQLKLGPVQVNRTFCSLMATDKNHRQRRWRGSFHIFDATQQIRFSDAR